MALPVWTADASVSHFTVDDGNHLADGTHYHTGRGGAGSGGSYAGVQYDIRQINADDEVILMAIRAFVQMEA